MEFDRKQLKSWLQLALETNTAFHKNRKDLLDALVKCKGRGVTIPARDFFTIKSYLSLRSSKIQDADDAQLAYQEQIGRLLESLEDEHDGEELEEGKNDNAPPGGGRGQERPKAEEH